MKINILVTGAGSLVGQGILRLLHKTRHNIFIVTADPDHRAPGHWLGNHGHVIPLASDINYGNKLLDIVKQHSINLLFVGTDVELQFLSRNSHIFEVLGCKVIVSPPDVVEIADSKYLTARFLKQNGFPYPKTFLSSLREDKQKLLTQATHFPLFAKPNRGARSVGAKIIKTSMDLASVLDEKDYVIQEFLEGPEYTAGCVRMNNSTSGVVLLKRDLKEGNTIRSYHDGTNKHQDFIKEVADKLNVYGPCNFQFIERDGIPVIFEINARCSGTTPIRSLFGFNEIDAIINAVIYNKPVPQPKCVAGTALRTVSDIFIPETQISNFEKKGELIYPFAKSFNFKSK